MDVNESIRRMRAGWADPERLQKMQAARAEGRTLASIGEEWGISKEQTGKILRRAAAR